MSEEDKCKASTIDIDAKCKAILDWVAERKVEPRISYLALECAHSLVEQRWLKCGAHSIPGPANDREMDLRQVEVNALLDFVGEPSEVVYEGLWAATNALGDQLYGPAKVTDERDMNWMGEFMCFGLMDTPSLLNSMKDLNDSSLRAAVDALANRARIAEKTVAEYLGGELVTEK